MTKIKYIVCLIGLILFSCNEDTLEVINKNGSNSETFMLYEVQAEEALVAAYDPLSHKGLYNYGFMVLGEVPTDNVINDWGDGNVGPWVVNIHNYIWNDDNLFFTLRWNGAYKGIYRTNFVLENLDKVTNFSSGKYDEIKGQALFLRALYYYNLVIGFDEVPLVITLLSAEESNNVIKSSASEIWAQIEADLEEAGSLLPPSYSESEIGRATKGAAYGLLSRARLWMKDYVGAEAAAVEVEKLEYDLVSGEDYIKMFDGRMENSSESLFESQFVPGFGAYFHQENAETTNLMAMFPRISWARYVRPRKTDTYDVVSHFEDEDIRRKSSILISFEDEIVYKATGDPKIFPDLSVYGDYRADLKVPGAYNTRKFLPYNTEYWRKGGAFYANGTSINVPIVRYAEVILNYAEALAEQGKLPEAHFQLERIRTRSGLTMVGISSTDKTALLDQIKKDRRVELMFEGHRWGDLKRWNELDKLTSAGLNFTSAHTKWPIPAQEKSINTNL